MPGRTYSSASYRYGFNGKENDNEVKGNGNQQDYGMRIYDARLGRFLSVDPLTRKFPNLTPYQFAGDKPIWCIDLDGLEDLPFTEKNQYGEKQIWVQVTVSPNGRFYTKQSITPNGATPVTQNMTDKEVYRLAVSRVLNPGAIKIADNQYLDEKYFQAEKSVNYYFSHLATATMANSPEMSALSADIHNITIGQLFSDDEATSENAVTRIDRRTNFWGKFNWGKTAVEFGGAALVNNLLKGAASRFASMANGEVRIWYNQQLAKLNTKVAFTEENALNLSTKRNAIKATARLMMKDRKAAAALDKSDPIRPFEYYVNKYTEQGYTGESLWQKIITGSAKPNAQKNAQFNIK